MRFWDYVSSLSVEQRSQLLQWITGYRRIPPGGFPAPVPYMTLYLANVGPDRLPTAHTCGLQLDLPRSYADAAQLGQRLGQASAERQFYLVSILKCCEFWLHRHAAGFQEPHSFGNGREPMEGDRAGPAYAAEFTSKRHFCRKAQCDGTCFRLDALAPPWPKPADAPDETDGLPEPPLKRRKMPSGVTETDTESTESSEAMGPPGAVTNSKVTDRTEGHQERPPAPAVPATPPPSVMSSMGHLVLDVTRMAAFSTAGYVLSGPLGATVAFSVASAKSLRNP
eukprot:s2511_g12.t1